MFEKSSALLLRDTHDLQWKNKRSPMFECHLMSPAVKLRFICSSASLGKRAPPLLSTTMQTSAVDAGDLGKVWL